MPVLPLSDVCSLITDGTHYTPADVGIGTPFLTVKDIQKNGALDFDGCSKISPDEYLKAAAGNSAPQLGDVLFSKDGTVGKVSVVRDEKQFAVLSSIAILRPNPDLVDSDYLAHALRSESVLDQALKKKTGSAIRRIILSDLKGVRFFVPSITEQRRIAAILDRADALRAKRREAIAKLDQLLQSLFLDMFGDPLTNSNGWRLQEINNLCTLVRGSSPRPQGDPNFFGGPVPRLMVADLTRDGWFVTPRIDSLTLEGAKRSRPTKAGTVVMAVSGNVGLASIISIDACIHDGFVGFSGLDESKVLPIFLLMSLHFLKNSHHGITAGAIFQNLTTTDIKKLAIPVPPMNDQRSYARRFNAIQKQKSKSGIAADKFEKFYQSIQLQAFGRAR